MCFCLVPTELLLVLNGRSHVRLFGSQAVFSSVFFICFLMGVLFCLWFVLNEFAHWL